MRLPAGPLLGGGGRRVTPTSAVLWAHADQPGQTQLQVATDEAFTQLVRRREVQAIPANDLTVQRRVDGLRPGTRYWYRFRGEAAVSDVGTFLTAPRPNDDATIRFAWTGDYDAARAIN